MEIETDEELATLASSRLAIHASFPQHVQPQPKQQQQQVQGVPGFPDFPTCWNGEERSLSRPLHTLTTQQTTAKVEDNHDNDDDDDVVDYKELEKERAMILAEARALKEAFLTQAQALKAASNRIPLRRKAVNRYGMRKGYYGVDRGSSSSTLCVKPQVHKKSDLRRTRKKQALKRTEVECLRKSLMGMRVTIKYKSA